MTMEVDQERSGLFDGIDTSPLAGMAEMMANLSLKVDYSSLFSAFDSLCVEDGRNKRIVNTPRNCLEAYMSSFKQYATVSTSEGSGKGFERIRLCKAALDAIDRTEGWARSFHQRLFHDNFIRACARIFWKTEPPGTFARDHQKILEVNGWDVLSQEILVSTPRR